MKEKNIINIARLLSIVFTPFYLPVVGLAIVFFLSYMSLLPLWYRLEMLLLVYVFTVLLPTLLIRLYRRTQGWTSRELGQRERRMVPYVISILCYFCCFFWLQHNNVPRLISIILVAALGVQMICALINVWWKISTHTAAIGGVAGALLAFAEVFMFNPVGWLCVVLIVAGMVGSARMILRQHTLAQVVAGFLVGCVTAFVIV